MVTWYDAVGLLVIGLIVGYLYGRHREFQDSISRRLEVLEQDREAHQRRTEEKNILGRFRNAIEQAYPGKFMADRVPKRHPSGGGSYLMFQRPDYRDRTLTVAVDVLVTGKEITLSIGGDPHHYPIAEVDKAISYAICHLLSNM